MTLGSWFRDYVYFPMGGSRCGKGKMVFNLVVVWLLTGLWHGEGVNFLLWGAILGLLIIMEKLWYGKYLQKLPVLGHIYLVILIPLSWVVFAITDPGAAWNILLQTVPAFGKRWRCSQRTGYCEIPARLRWSSGNRNCALYSGSV